MKISDGVIYGLALGAIVFLCGQWQDVSMAPRAPPPLTPSEAAIFSAFTPFIPGSIISIPSIDQTQARGSAFSLADSGAWAVTRDALKNCSHPYLSLGANLGVPVKIKTKAALDGYQVVVTGGGVRPLSMADTKSVKTGIRGFMIGYPHGQAGEATGRLIGRTLLHSDKRGQKRQEVLAWSEAGHTMGLTGSLQQLAGGPVLNSDSQVMGIVISYNPRRGRIYSSTPEIAAKMSGMVAHKPDFDHEDTLTKRNYGIVADTLRRQYRVMPLACLSV